MIAIHPAHVPVINEVFGPSPAETAFYQGLVSRLRGGGTDRLGSRALPGPAYRPGTLRQGPAVAGRFLPDGQ